MSTRRVLFVGAGRMAQAMIAGMLRPKGRVQWDITVANRGNRDRLQKLRDRLNVQTTENWQETVPNVDVIVLAIPPGGYAQACAALHPLVRREQLVVSIAAGIGPSRLAESLPSNIPTAWLMPNTGAEIGQSMTLCACGPTVSDEQQQILVDMQAGMGQSFLCSEQQVHDLTAITGSALAFVFRAAGVFEQMSIDYGVDAADAHTLVGQMLQASAQLLLRGDESPASLADAVTTPGGATAAGLAVLAQGGYEQLLAEAVKATNRRAAELGKVN